MQVDPQIEGQVAPIRNRMQRCAGPRIIVSIPWQARAGVPLHETSKANEDQMYVAAQVGKLLSKSLLDMGSWTADLEAEREKAWTHEAMHTKSVHDQLALRETWEQIHDLPFQQAAFRILGLGLKQ